MDAQLEWIEKQGTVTIAHLSLEYASADVSAMTGVQRRLLQWSEQAEPPLLLWDLADTACFGAEFMNIMLRCYGLIKRREGWFALCNVKSTPLEMLKVTHLNTLWPIYLSQDEAIQGIQQETPV